MRILGFVFLSLIVATAVVTVDFFLPGTFLDRFLDTSFLETFGGLIGFNIAAVIFLIGQLMNFEERLGKAEIFIKTRTEIKQNAYFLLSSFVVCLILLIVRPDLGETGVFNANEVYYAINILVLCVFGLSIYSIFEILRAVFLMSKNTPRQ